MEKQEVTYLIFFITIIFLALFIFVISISLNYYRRNRKYNKSIIDIQYKKEQEILKSQLEIQEQTLKNISQEIHDNIGQALTLVKLNLNTMLPGANEQMHEKIVNSKELISKAIGDLRDLSRSLDTDYVKEMGLQRAVEYELEMIQKTGTIKTALQVEGAMIRLEKQNELILFRILQETFHNIIKHAEARNLQVDIFYKSYELELLIQDDGKGLDLAPLNEANNNSFGLGIRNMNSRAKLIGADFNMSSTLGGGTQVKIILPLKNSNNENKQ